MTTFRSASCISLSNTDTRRFQNRIQLEPCLILKLEQEFSDRWRCVNTPQRNDHTECLNLKDSYWITFKIFHFIIHQKAIARQNQTINQNNRNNTSKHQQFKSKSITRQFIHNIFKLDIWKWYVRNIKPYTSPDRFYFSTTKITDTHNIFHACISRISPRCASRAIIPSAVPQLRFGVFSVYTSRPPYLQILGALAAFYDRNKVYFCF